MAHIRKLRRKWQVQVRKQKIKVTKSFWKKSDASKWALKTEAQIETGSYLNARNKLFSTHSYLEQLAKKLLA